MTDGMQRGRTTEEGRRGAGDATSVGGDAIRDGGAAQSGQGGRDLEGWSGAGSGDGEQRGGRRRHRSHGSDAGGDGTRGRWSGGDGVAAGSLNQGSPCAWRLGPGPLVPLSTSG